MGENNQFLCKSTKDISKGPTIKKEVNQELIRLYLFKEVKTSFPDSKEFIY